jgi:N-acetyl sugar amidotransferase
MSEYRICKRCVMDSSDPDIVFDEEGVCNHCKKAYRLLASEPYALPPADKQRQLEKLAARIREEGKGKAYDCIIGVSGGADSTYAAWMVRQCGLRPLAIHLDNGWNSRLAVTNIERILKKLEIDLFTYVIDWEEFRDLQLSFLKASTPDSEVPTDHAIVALLYRMAAKYKVKYILAGTNIASESILPRSWSYGHSDWKYIRSLQKRFGTKKLKTFPHFNLVRLFVNIAVRKIRFISILNYTEYIKEDAVEMLSRELGWENYGGKHHESVYTQYYQACILPGKFGFDKRRAHLSSLICAGQLSRETALEELSHPACDPKVAQEARDYVVSKFSIPSAEFDEIMQRPPKRFADYPSYEASWYYRMFKAFYRFLGRFGIRKSDF